MKTTYLDMDGVQADFLNSWAKWYSEKTGKQISNYKDIGDAEAQLASIMELTNSDRICRTVLLTPLHIGL